MNTEPKRLLFFIGSLATGGKERRLIELLSYLKAHSQFQLTLVMTKDVIHYTYFKQLNIPYEVIDRKSSGALSMPLRFYRICRKFKPHLIHTWGRMQTLYALPAVIGQNIALINGQITAAPPRINRLSFHYWIDRLNFICSRLIVANSHAGIQAYRPPANKCTVVYNGVNPERFQHLPDKEQVLATYGIETPVAVVMAASFSENKDYDRFLRIAEKVVRLRPQVTFIGVGASATGCDVFDRVRSKNSNPIQILFPGRSNHVEALVNACTIGVLFSADTHGEGISNAIIEYMSLGKPVVANDSGGTREVVHHGKNGYLITTQTDDEVADLLLQLIDDPELCSRMGAEGYRMIQSTFTLPQMGRAFHRIYNSVLGTEEVLTKAQPVSTIS
ncbi:glycosyltransferase family 4 protein [Paracnuella aquatica]|uniref:glycosyltransferase family 4 protein n=1 Tax=Paracnuella aquatica TaxID=2268757 RepID=UPI000DEFFFBB|nr:glycosyltransferase family 4 protein [Paracnuella aquatica]RPD49000.1 glycosyltransferase [Paracnuella aquatica]